MIEVPLGQIVTPAASTVTAAAAVYTAGRVRQGINSLLETVEENEKRSKYNRRLLLGSDVYDGVVARVEQVEDERDV